MPMLKRHAVTFTFALGVMDSVDSISKCNTFGLIVVS